MIRWGKISRPPWHVTYDDETQPDGRAIESFSTEADARAFADVKTAWGKNGRVTFYEFGKASWAIQFYWPFQFRRKL